MQVQEAMTKDVLTVDEEQPIAAAARLMSDRDIGAAVVTPAGGGAPGILTERDVVRLVGEGHEAGSGTVVEHCTAEAVSAPPDWSLDRAAGEMVSGGFRHLIVVDGGATIGILSMRDIVRGWTAQRLFAGRRIQIHEATGGEVLLAERDQSLRELAHLMIEREVGAAVVEGRKRGEPPGIVTERVVLRAVAAGLDPNAERVADHISTKTTFSARDWSLTQAAEAMTKGGFQHVVVVDGERLGLISMREILGHWVSERED